MVSKLIVAGTLFFGAVFAGDVTVETKDFEEAICTKSYKPHTETKALKLDDLIATHGCSDKATHLCLIETKDTEGSGHLMCSAKKHEDFDKKTIKMAEGFHLHDKVEFKETVTKIECKEAKHTYKHDLKEALLAMDGKKENLKDLGEVKETDTACFYVVEEEDKKEKADGDKKEVKKISKVYWFTVKGKKDYKPTQKVEELTIFEKKYKGLTCGKTEDLEKEAKAFEKAVEKAVEKAEEASGCCSCAWYVWVIVAVVIVGAGAAGAYVIFKADEDEDEFANEYSA